MSSFDPQRLLDDLRVQREKILGKDASPVGERVPGMGSNSFFGNSNTNVVESIQKNGQSNQMVLLLMKEIEGLKTHINGLEADHDDLKQFKLQTEAKEKIPIPQTYTFKFLL